MSASTTDKFFIFILTLGATFLWSLVGLGIYEHRAVPAVVSAVFATLISVCLVIGLVAD